MAFSGFQYGDISPRVGVFAVAKFLSHADSQLVLAKFASSQSLPKNKSQTLKWRRCVPFAVSTTTLTEGVTPPPQGFEYEDVSVSVSQYGAWNAITDVVTDTYEDPVLSNMAELCGKQAADTQEAIIWGVIRNGSNVIFTGSATARTGVNAVITLDDIRAATRELKAMHCKKITKRLSASPNFGTEAVNGSYIAVSHSNMERDFREMTSFVPIERYASGGAIHENEIGKVEEVRVILTPHLEPFFGAGDTTLTGVLNNGTRVDVYPVVIFGEEAFGVASLKGMDSANISVMNPKMGASYEDPLGQRGFVSWKFWFAAVRLNENWMIKIESACTAL